MLRTWEAWEDPADKSITLLGSGEGKIQQANGLLSTEATLLYRFQAQTFEEASAIHALRMGWDPYRPIGEPTPCPRCGAIYYPGGSAECWRCDPST